MTKYSEVVQYIYQEIAGGAIKPGMRLPAIRAVAERFGCSKTTAVRAYTELERDHVIYPVPQSGYYLVENRHQAPPPETVDFASTTPDSGILPYREFQHCLNQAVELYRADLFSYCPPQGKESSLKVIARHLEDYQVFADWTRLVVTAGSQQALAILTALPFPNGKTNILIEQPTYYGIIKLLELNGGRMIGIERTRDGFDMDTLESFFRNGNVKLFYTIPRFHNPTGLSYPAAVKKKLVALAEKYDVYIVEDDCLADLEIDSKADPLFAYSRAGKVIYLKSYSKTFLPGLRVAATVLPPNLVQPFVEYKQWNDLSSPTISQAALEIFINSGLYDTHCRHFRKVYRDRMQCLREVAAAHPTPNAAWIIPETGFFASFTLSGPLSGEGLASRLALSNIHIFNAEPCFISNYRRNNLFRISLGKTGEQMIRAGIPAVIAEIDRLKTVDRSRAGWPEF